MKKTLRSLLVVSSLFALAACSVKKNDKPVDPTPVDPVNPPDPETHEIDVRFTGYYDGNIYNVKMPYRDELFIGTNSKQASRDLAVQSFGLAVSADTFVSEGDYSGADSHLRYYFNNAGFNNVFINDEYNAKPTTDSIGYGFASKQLSDGNTLVAISVRGGGYEAEWGDNFDIGEDGPHVGFAKQAAKILADFSDYTTENNINYSQLKLWITGYSRGGAVANIFASAIDFLMTKSLSPYSELTMDKIYAYTFEAPGCYEIENDDATDYSNIINVKNERDFVPLIPPAKYGLGLNGQTLEIAHDVTDEELLEKMEALIPDFEIPTFYAVDPVDTETEMTPQEFYGYLINDFLTCEMTPAQKEEGKIVDLSTRANFATYMQPHIGYVISLLMTMTSEQMSTLSAYFTDNMMSMMSIISQDKDSLYAFIKDGFTAAEFTQYVDEDLHTHCDGLQLVIYSLGVMHGGIMGLLPALMQVYSNVSYIIFQHCQEGMLSYIQVLADRKN